MLRRTFLAGSASTAAVLAFAGRAFAQAAATATGSATAATGPTIPPWGFDLAGMDRSVRPGDDFNRFASGTWIETTEIPADRARWGAFDALREQSVAEVRALLEELVANPPAEGTIGRKIADFYTSYVDQAAIDAKGLAPIQPTLTLIADAPDPAALAVLAARPGLYVPAPIAWFLSIDEKNPDRYAVNVTHTGLGMPNRTFYVGETVKPGQREAYQAHIARLLTLAEYPEAERHAAAILAFETQIAERHWLPAERRERDKTYNPKTRAELRGMAPAYPWQEALEASGFGPSEVVVVGELSAMQPLAELWANTPMEVLRPYCTYHALRQAAPVLPVAFDDEVFAFFGKELQGQPEKRSREKRAVDAIGAALGEGVGELYVARHFPATSKAQMLELVENLRRAYGERIAALSWMSDETKTIAAEKLATFRPKIGYPDRWRDYTALEIRPGDAFGNAVRAEEFDHARDVARQNEPTDRDEWFMTPQTVNAYYNPTFNEIVFPAAILRAPFFDPAADPAINYGAIGGVIGHEMGHGFDDQGAKSDPRGVLRTWWNERDVAAFQQVTGRLASQYSAFTALPGLNLNGQLGLGENIGDNGGLQVAYAAYKLATAGQEPPVLDGFTGDQRFFLGWAQVWRTLYREEALRTQVKVGPHSPGQFRCNGTVRNMDAWYAAFDVQAEDDLYLPDDQRVTIW